MVTYAKLAHTFNYDGVVLNIYHANKGEGIPSHAHPYSHATFCTAGSCKYTQEDRSIIATKETQPVNLLAAQFHEIEAMEDGTVFVNVFAENKY